LANAGSNTFLNAVGGGYGVNNSPAFSTLQGITQGANAPFNQIQSLQDLSSRAISPNTGTNSLADTASGKYLNANPYLDKMFGAASDAVTRAYQSSTAPQTDSQFERSGRFGSGSLLNARSQNEQNLGNSLDNLAAQIYGGNYATERGLQNSAAGTLGTLTNQGIGLGMTGQKAAGDLLTDEQKSQLAAAGFLQSGYQTGNSQALQGLALQPSVIGASNLPNQMITQGGQGLTGLNQQQIDDAMKRYYGEQLAPWQTAQMAAGFIGGPYAPSTSTTTPYFANPTANALSGLSGGVGLLSGINGLTGGSLSSGLSSLFGGSGAGTATGVASALYGGGLDYGGGGVLGAGYSGLGDALAAGLPAEGFGFSDLLGSLAFLGI
jgi:hypothetical protein